MWRVLDMSLSAHSSLRDRYRRREVGLTLLILALSILATSLAFLSGERDVDIGPFTARLGVWVGSLTALIFFLALADLLLNWRKRAWAHENAARRLSELKGKFRAATITENRVDTSIDLKTEYEQTMNAVAEIPERQFLAMKAKHHRKVAVSKLIDLHPGAPVPFLRLLAVWRGLRERTPSGESVTESVEEPPA